MINLIVTGTAFAAAFAAAACSWLRAPGYPGARQQAPDAPAPPASAGLQAFRTLPAAHWAVLLTSSALCACLASLVWDAAPFPMQFCRLAAALLYLLSAALFDYRIHMIPNFLTAAAVLCGLVLSGLSFALRDGSALADLLICVFGAMCTFAVFYLLARVTRGGLGMGDVKLISAMVWLLGPGTALYSVLLGLVLCAIPSLVLMVGKKRSRSDHIPFAPFAFGGYAVMLLLRF